MLTGTCGARTENPSLNYTIFVTAIRGISSQPTKVASNSYKTETLLGALYLAYDLTYETTQATVEITLDSSVVHSVVQPDLENFLIP